ncbi:hypothetical protein [Haloferula sp. BvORR071]|uniref:hypothetical protein n=1 Tax=Haloferula sp. BvORR071 TaxID=1396141 RepID=UPI00054F2EC6|nr:hypothetical protein [Haloferula sp. BvORR071]
MLAYWAAFFALVLFLLGLGAGIGAWKRRRGMRRVIGLIGGVLFAIGAGSFAGTGAVSLYEMPGDVEWPVGNSAQIIRLADGRQLAFHEPSGRIQLYDASGHFSRGWSIVGGGLFEARLIDAETLEIWASRGAKRFLLNPDGVLTDAGTYAPQSYEDFHGEGQKGSLPTPWPLMVLTHPMIAWAFGFGGLLMLGLSDPKKRKAWYRRKTDAPDLT